MIEEIIEYIIVCITFRLTDPMNFLYNLIFLIGLFCIQYFLNRKSTKKSDIATVFTYGLVIPLILAIVGIFAAPNGFGGFLLIVCPILFFLALNFSEVWFRENLAFKGERGIVMKFADIGSESERVRVYEDDSYIPRPLSEVMERSAEIGQAFLDESFYTNVIDLHNDLEKDDRYNSDMSEEQQKEIAREILVKRFGHYHVHQIFFHFYFMNVDSEDSSVHSYVKAYILCESPRLPNDIVMTCAMLQEQKVKSKKHTVIVGVEGVIDEVLAQRLRLLSPDMEFFKLTNQFGDTTRIEIRLNYYMNKCDELVEENQHLHKVNMTINEKIAHYKRQTYKKTGYFKKRRNKEDEFD